jgi:hypothetical protein
VEAVPGVVDDLERALDVGNRSDRDDRAEDLLVPGLLAVREVEQDGGADDRA